MRAVQKTRKPKRAPKRASVVPSQPLPPHLEFLERHQGSIPEIIGTQDLDTLNSAFGFFFARLREARRQFDHEGDNGRLGAFTALAAFWMFVVLFKGPHAESLQVPILRLQDALAGLENNLVSPIVKPIGRRGRAPSSNAHAALRGFAAGTVKRLVDIGLTHPSARREVAKRLCQLGVRPERGAGSVTADTVESWCDDVSSDVGRHGTAAQMYDSMFARLEEQQRLSTMPRGEARRHALDSLSAWVQTMFPELQKPT
jgi:hypothetical protein